MVQKISHELRSEKAKNIISPIPIGLIKYGILSIIGGVILLVILMTFIPVRESISGNIYRKDSVTVGRFCLCYSIC